MSYRDAVNRVQAAEQELNAALRELPGDAYVMATFKNYPIPGRNDLIVATVTVAKMELSDDI